jgi:manganese transport protein
MGSFANSALVQAAAFASAGIILALNVILILQTLGVVLPGLG